MSANVMYARRSDYMKDDYGGSSLMVIQAQVKVKNENIVQIEKQNTAQGGDNDGVNEMDILKCNQVLTRRNTRNRKGNNYSESSASNGSILK